MSFVDDAQAAADEGRRDDEQRAELRAAWRAWKDGGEEDDLTALQALLGADTADATQQEPDWEGGELDDLREWVRAQLLAKPAPEPITDWRAIDAPPREWLIRDWLPAGRIGMLSGKGGSGKSMLAVQLAAALASGEREWLGRAGVDSLLPLATDTPWPVVYAGYEDEAEEIRRRPSSFPTGARGLRNPIAR